MKNKSKMANSLMERLKKDLTNEKQMPSVEKKLDEENLKGIIDFNLIKNLTEDKDLQNFLKEESIKLFSIQSKAVIELGKIFNDVYDKLSKQGSADGLYEKWLSLNNFNKTTAWRYRQRFELFSKVEEDKKNMIAILPYGIINNLYKNYQFEEIIKIINTNDNKEALKEVIINKELNLEEKKISEFKEVEYKIFSKSIQNKIENLEDEKRKKIEEYVREIEKLLK
ncbi:hypothetical protein [Cetobacterium ceti]